MVQPMDSHRVASSGSYSSMRSSIMVLRVSLSSRVATRVAKRIALSVVSFSLVVRSLEALVRSDNPKGRDWKSTGLMGDDGRGGASGIVYVGSGSTVDHGF
jgi:hypothetical protein